VDARFGALGVLSVVAGEFGFAEGLKRSRPVAQGEFWRVLKGDGTGFDHGDGGGTPK